MRSWLWLLPCTCLAAGIPVDLSGVQPGPISATSTAEAVDISWPDEQGRTWRAEFSLDASKPLITAISLNQAPFIQRANPFYRVATGKRRGGWDAFFDFPPSHPEGTRRFEAVFQRRAARAITEGNRVRIVFDGLRMGIFSGSIAYTFYPGTRLIRQEAIAATEEPDTAYYYDAGLRMAVDADRRPGDNMDSWVAYYDTGGRFREVPAAGPEREPVAVRFRTLAARVPRGSVVVFPAPHQYFFARDYTTNMGYLWHRAWRGEVGVGIRQMPDDNSPFYPWMNAPPGTAQHMSLWIALDDRAPRTAIEDVLRYTHHDHFPALPGYRTLAAHWHFAYTVQAMARGMDWVPPFKPVLEDMGVDAAMIMDFHGDGHPRDLGDTRGKELRAFYEACRAQSDTRFHLIPAEEANVYLGGHWALVFPHPVYWYMSRPPGTEFRTEQPKHGPVYHVGNSAELLEMVRREGGYIYQTHPRTKGSTGFPDEIRGTEHFRNPRYLGAGWKAMPSDLSLPRLGERAFKLLDDMCNWGLRKRLTGEVDVFQIDATHELYAHMNVNYVRTANLGGVLDAWARGDYFVTTGEVLLPEVNISGADEIGVSARVRNTFPLALAEVVWGDGGQTRRRIFSLDATKPFEDTSHQWTVPAPGWKWARLAVWDVAGNGAFTNPTWK